MDTTQTLPTESDTARLPNPPAVAALAGAMLTRVIVDDALTLALRSDRRESTVRIDAAGVMRDAAGRASTFAPDESPASVACILALLQERVDEARVEPDGTLRLALGRATIEALPHDHQISWAVRTSDGLSASCLADGMVVWE